jgi:hypothetical protein
MDMILLDRVKWIMKKFDRQAKEGDSLSLLKSQMNPEGGGMKTATLPASKEGATQGKIETNETARSTYRETEVNPSTGHYSKSQSFNDQEDDNNDEMNQDGASLSTFDSESLNDDDPNKTKKKKKGEHPEKREPIIPTHNMKALDLLGLKQIQSMLTETIQNSKEHLHVQLTHTMCGMLLAIIDFLCDGDVSGLSAEDRRDWISTIIESSEPPNTTSDTAPMPQTATTQAYSLVDDVEMITMKSWRHGLLSLRTMFLEGGHSAKGWRSDFYDPSTKAYIDNNMKGIYARVLQMRGHIEEVMQRQAAKYRYKSSESKAIYENYIDTYRVSSKNDEELNGHDDENEEHRRLYVEPLNIYAGNISKVLDVPELFDFTHDDENLHQNSSSTSNVK